MSDNDDEDFVRKVAEGRRKALERRRKEAFEDSDDSDEDIINVDEDGFSLPPALTNTVAAPVTVQQVAASNTGEEEPWTWSQLHFKELMQKSRPHFIAAGGRLGLPQPTVAPAPSPMAPLQLFHKTNINGTSETSSLTTPSSREDKSTTRTSTFVHNCQPGNEISERLERVVRNAEASLSGSIKKNKSKKRRTTEDQAAKKQAKEAKRRQKADEKAAKEAEAGRLLNVRREIDWLVENFRPEFYSCVKIRQVKHPKNSEDDADYNVAHMFVVAEGKPNEKRYSFEDFTNTQLRRICVSCNIKGGGSFSNWQAITALASWATAGTVYSENNIANPFTTSSGKRLNTYMRIINVCFLSTMVQRFVDLNDRKKQEDYEKSSGTDPIKDFFVEASNICNDATMNNTLSGVAGSQEDED